MSRGGRRGVACAEHGEFVVEGYVAASVNVDRGLEPIANNLLLAIEHAHAKVRDLRQVTANEGVKLLQQAKIIGAQQEPSMKMSGLRTDTSFFALSLALRSET